MIGDCLDVPPHSRRYHTCTLVNERSKEWYVDGARLTYIYTNSIAPRYDLVGNISVSISLQTSAVRSKAYQSNDDGKIIEPPFHRGDSS